MFLPGYKISACETIGDGIALATQQSFALYLLNLSLPDGSGFSLCQKIRVFDLNTPIVVISIHDSESYRKYALQAGAYGFWAKNGDLHQLKTTIERCLFESRLRSFEAKRAEFAAIRDELAQQREEARARQAQAREIQAQYREKRVMLAASRASSKMREEAGPIFRICGRKHTPKLPLNSHSEQDCRRQHSRQAYPIHCICPCRSRFSSYSSIAAHPLTVCMHHLA